jgi:hypothetical protein
LDSLSLGFAKRSILANEVPNLSFFTVPFKTEDNIVPSDTFGLLRFMDNSVELFNVLVHGSSESSVTLVEDFKDELDLLEVVLLVIEALLKLSNGAVGPGEFSNLHSEFLLNSLLNLSLI